MARGANQLDVARAAGVSVSTVSRALSNSRGISAELREEIRRLAEELGYEPRGGREQRTVRAYATMSAVSSGDAGFYQVLLEQLKQAAETAGLALQLVLVDPRDMNAERIAADAGLPEPSATLLVGMDPSDEVASLYGPARPLILVNALDPAMRFDCVTPNNFFGAMIATRALLAAGHRDLLYLRDHTRRTTLRRQRGFMAAIDEAGGASGTIIDVLGSRDAIANAIADRKAGRTQWTAVFCMHDQVAIPLVDALTAAGFNVPRDISVIGFDDLAPASMLNPGLSTMRVDCASLAREAVALLLRRLAEPEASIIQVECAVLPIPRETVAQIA